jgi:thiol-disulfide isomerase/thioredoxin
MSYTKYKNLGGIEDDHELISSVIRIKSDLHRQEIIANNRITLIDYYTDWCKPCQDTTQSYAKLSKKYINICALVKENVNDDIYGAEEISSVPCFHFYIDGIHIPEYTITGGDILLVEEYIQKSIERFNIKN